MQKLNSKKWNIVRPPLAPTFDMPTRQELYKVFNGDSVKLIFSVDGASHERMWVTVTKCGDMDHWEGTLDNEPAQEATAAVLKPGQRITFHPYDVISVLPQDEDISHESQPQDEMGAQNTIVRRWYKNPQVLATLFGAVIGSLATIIGAIL